MAGPRENKLTVPLLALLLLTNRGAAPDDVTKMKPPDWTIARSGGSKVVVFLKELCNEDSYGSDGVLETAEDYKRGFMQYMKMKGANLPSDIEVSFLPKTVVCETSSRGLSAILDALSQESTRALMGSIAEDMCDVTTRLADMWGKPLLSWSCPQVTRGTQRLVPSLEETANAIVGLAMTLSWRSAVIITSDVGWWPVLANKIEVGLQELGVTPRHLYWENQALRGLHSAHTKVIILCASLRSSTGETILQAIDSLKLSQTIVLAIDVSSFVPFIPKIVVQDHKLNHRKEEIEKFSDSEDVFQNDAPVDEDDSEYDIYFSDELTYKSKDDNQIREDKESEKYFKIDNRNRLIVDDNNDVNENSDEESNNYMINSLIFVNNETVSDVLTNYINSNKSNVKNVSLDDLIDKLLKVDPEKDEKEFTRRKIVKGDNDSNLSYDGILRNISSHEDVINTGHKNFTQLLPKVFSEYKNTSNIWENKNIKNFESNVETDESFIMKMNDKNITLRQREESLVEKEKNETNSKRNNEANIEKVNKTDNSYVNIKRRKTYINIYNSSYFNGLNSTKKNGEEYVSPTNIKILSEYFPNTNDVNESNSTSIHSTKSESTYDNLLLEFKKEKYVVRQKRSSWHHRRYEMFENISVEMKKSFMILTSMDSRQIVIDEFIEKSTKNELFEHIHEGMNIVTNENSDNRSDKVFKFLFLDWKEDFQDQDSASHWRPLVILQYSKNATLKGAQESDILSTMSIFKVQPNFDDWYENKGLEFDEDSCDGDFCIRAQIKVNSIHIVIIIVSALVFCAISIGVGLIVRNILLKKRLSKGPNKIVLTATDFVFPQVPDSRRVDEGIEAMLCCWLQQLQEFGGPEVVDKPDLLKGSMGSLGAVGQSATSAAIANVANNRGPSSNGSLAKNNYIVDHRIRYNGDLVQLKNLPSVGTFELKSKAMDLLVLTHGLRHENLNPFIGCLTDPTRPALVHEHCSRGSLEDVLMMDEIKLDWSFRLSLLTDLVRGMRYLHSTPLKVHGNLTSRNCVIDARWVLKITDYGLPAFYEAQGIPATAKNARDLLWTAPELLRHCGLRRKGSQPGDVYSFAIIMQEVVVRGEPFCMLALSPEEIIEKVKKPPPLIRPSVSKGAAPPEAIHIMRQCWTEQPEMRPDFTQVHDLFRKLNHGRKVNFVDTMFQMLEKYSNNLEELIRERTEQLDMEKKKTEQLLNRMLPSYVADKLKLGMPVDPEEFSEVSIYFSDIVGFTSISAHSTPFQVVDLLNDLYTCFDATINAYNVYKVETIGDAYMVVGGLPVRIADHAEQVATMALDLLHQSGRFKIRHLPRTPLHLRIGLHTGPCCAGVVGLTMPRYCLFGDTVNTASRMESTGSAWRIHLSQATRDKLEAAGGYTLEYRGKTEVKGKGKMPTYWLLGKAGFDKVLPVPPPIGLEDPLLSPRLDDHSPASEISSSHAIATSILTAADSIAEKLSPHFSIDRTFFSVEKQSSPSKPNTSIQTNSKPDHFLPRVINGERKKPLLETPNNSQEQGEIGIIPTIKTEMDDGLITVDPTKNELPITNLLQQGKLHTAINQINQYTLGAPVSASEVAAALLGSSTSLVSNRYKDISKYKRSLMIESHDLSSPYNHYRCLSPSDSNISQLNHGKILDRQNPGKLLKRQFSLDRADDSGNAVPESNLATQTTPRVQQRLCKQNSAGAAPDLERIEEVPLSMGSPKSYRRRLESTATFPGSSKSISSESLVTGQR